MKGGLLRWPRGSRGSNGQGAIAAILAVPPAGTAAGTFRRLQGHVRPDTQVCAVELPGRGSRRREPPVDTVSAAAAVVEEAALRLADLGCGPVMLLGHSFGGVVAYEAARRIGPSGSVRGLLTYGTRPPWRNGGTGDDGWHLLDDDALVARLLDLGAQPASLLQDLDARAYFLPPIRADLKMLAEYRWDPDPPFDLPLVAAGGRDDPLVGPCELAGWARARRGPFVAARLDGAHFLPQHDVRTFATSLEPVWRRWLFGPVTR